jgi:methionyl-tRNA formyltransferase
MSNKILFFGSGPVAAESLRLLAQDFEIEAVVTKAPPPHHHGAVPVLAMAGTLQLPVSTVSNKHDLTKLFATKPFKSPLGILIDFGIIVPQPVIDYFPLGIINSHFSVLPEWRGADPITFAILSGQKQTGVSLMQLVEAMDEGPLLAYGEYDLPPDITTPQLTEDLINFSNMLLQRTIPKYLSDKKPGKPQSITGRQVSYSRKLTKDDGLIDWHKPAVELEREIRAFIEWPKSRTKLGSTDVIITKAHAMPSNNPGAKPGDIEVLPQGVLIVESADSSLCIDRLKPAGKPEMTAQAFLAGYKFDTGAQAS